MSNMITGGENSTLYYENQIKELREEINFLKSRIIFPNQTLLFNKSSYEFESGDVNISLADYNAIKVFMIINGYGISSTNIVLKDNLHLYDGQRFDCINAGENSGAWLYHIKFENDIFTCKYQLQNDYTKDVTTDINIYGLK